MRLFSAKGFFAHSSGSYGGGMGLMNTRAFAPRVRAGPAPGSKAEIGYAAFMRAGAIAVVCLSCSIRACGSSSSGDAPQADSDLPDAEGETSPPDARSDVVRDGGAETTDALPDTPPVPPPTADDIQFSAKNPLPL